MRALVLLISLFALLVRGDFALAATTTSHANPSHIQQLSAEKQLKSSAAGAYWTLDESDTDGIEETTAGDKIKDAVCKTSLETGYFTARWLTADSVLHTPRNNCKAPDPGVSCHYSTPIYISLRVLRI